VTRLVLIGPRGSGKTAVGTRAAALLGVALIDTDAEIEARGETVVELFATCGEPGFRAVEREGIAALAPPPGAVIATGGGAVLDPDNRARLRDWGRVIYLSAPAEVLAARITGTDRPRLAGDDALEETRLVLAAREAIYRELADVVLDTGEQDVESVAGELVRLAREGGPA
jgi:shikimate kinase